MKQCLLSIVMLLASFVLPFSAIADDAKPKPLRVLLISGGCCHDYPYQAKKFQEEAAKIANIEWVVEIDPRKGTKGEIDLYSKADWAKGYDVVVHNECFADVNDVAFVERVAKAHHNGVPAVVIHCTMHTFRGDRHLPPAAG